MGQAGPYLRRAEHGYAHWCPGCEEMHGIPDVWSFNGNLEAPTFSPSVRITGKKRVVVNGEWTGEWIRDEAGNAVDGCCHYNLTEGVLHFFSDSTHALAGQTAPLPDLPPIMRDQ